LFLDEIGEIPSSTQVKLLRVLEEREVTRVGGTASIPVNVRVVAATNQPLRQLVEEGAFRSDLYYRLNVLNIYLPPLRERREDIPLLVRRFVREISAQHDRTFHGIAGDAMQLLVEYGWPGNVRQLRNLIESMVVLSPGREITAADIPREVRDGSAPSLLPVRVLPPSRGAETENVTGRELEFIFRSLVDLRLQVEELRQRLDEGRGRGRLGLEVQPAEAPVLSGSVGGLGAAIAAPVEPPGGPPNVMTVTPGMTMADIERGAIESALRETAGNRRRAAELLGIGERTLYRKLREYQIPDSYATLD
jgi:DNA-binding NtrC family response regulator